jgi:ATP-dependent DNA helicase RecQ
MIATQELHTLLKTHFGYDSFRPNQKEIIQSICNGEDALVVMPTGGGKSMCFQLPALALEGVALVISPLIALMKDQVDALRANGIKAAYYNSTQPPEEIQEVMQSLRDDKLDLIYVAPESLSLLNSVLGLAKISLIAIDEAHCISSWGHDFRPAYTQLGHLKKQFINTPLIALTATADRSTQDDIAEQLGISNTTKYISSFDRPNLYLDVRPGQKRNEQILAFLNLHPFESGIIYCLSRKGTETLALKLQSNGHKAAYYHAGMTAENRTQVQEDFINDTMPIICATIAFGMGIDKSNVRWVIHYNMPKNLEGYYQEIGRAGRDGLPAHTLLFYSYADTIQLRKFIEGSQNESYQLAKLERRSIELQA